MFDHLENDHDHELLILKKVTFGSFSILKQIIKGNIFKESTNCNLTKNTLVDLNFKRKLKSLKFNLYLNLNLNILYFMI